LDVLELLWLISASLTAASLAILCGVIVSRAVTDHFARIDAARSRLLVPLLLAEPLPATGATRPPTADRRLVRVAAELGRRAAGPDERRRILANAQRLGVGQRLRADLRSRFARRRSTAATLLAVFADADSVAALTAALADSDRAVRLTAALSLARLGRAPAALTLVETLGLGTDVHEPLATALFDEIAATHPAQLLALIARPGLSSEVRRAAVEALVAVPDSGVAGVLIALARDSDLDVGQRAFCLRKLGEAGDRAAAPVVAEALADAHPRVRSAAAEAAGRLGLEAAVPRLEQLAGDANWWVRFSAAEALWAIGGRGHARLRALATGGTATARKTAALTLAEHGLAA
jgi:HEAT repeat protein